MSNSWPMTALGDVLRERRETPDELEVAQGKIPIVAKIGFNDGRLELRREAGSKTNMILVMPGDLLVSGINAAKGAIAIYGAENERPAAATIHYSAYEVIAEKSDINYLWLYLRSSSFRSILLEALPGGIKTELRAKRLLPIEVPLPPLDEQRRIVARVNRLYATIRKAQEINNALSSDLSILQGSIISSLIPNDAPMSELKDVIEPYSKISYGVLVPGPDIDDGIPFVRVQDLSVDNPPQRPSKRIAQSIESQYSRTRLDGNEILVAVVGSIGKIGIVPSSWKGANIARAVCRIVPGPSMDREYLAITLQSQKVQQYFVDLTRTLAQPTLNVRDLEKVRIPQPPIETQKKVVEHYRTIRRKMAEVREAEMGISAEIEALMPSVLDKAFKGEL